MYGDRNYDFQNAYFRLPMTKRDFLYNQLNTNI